MPFRTTALIIAFALQSCSPQISHPQKNCAFAPPYFWRYGDGVAEGLQTMPDLNTVYISKVTKSDANVSSEHTVRWNGRLVSFSTLDRYLQEVGALIPQPHTVLDFPAGAPCLEVAKVRALMEKHLDCKNSLACVQGFNQDKLPPEPQPAPH
jgi:hypothetical protein